MLFPIIPLYAASLGLGPSAIGGLIAAHSVLSIFLGIFVGRLSDVISTRWIIACGILSNLLGGAFLLLKGGFLYILISQLFSGIGFLMIIVGSQTHISLFEPPPTRARAFAFISFNASVGQIIGPFLGGLVASSWGYRPLFWIVTLINILAFLGLGFIGGGDSSTREKRDSNVSLSSQVRALLQKRSLVRLLVFTFVVVFITCLKGSFLPLLLRGRGFSKMDIGTFLSLFSISMAIIRLVMDRILRWIGKEESIYVVMALLFLGVGIIASFSLSYFIILGLLLWGCGFGISQPLSMYLISEQLTPDTSGIGMGLRFTVITSSAFLSPLVFGIIGEHMSLDAIFYISTFIVILSTIYFYLSKPLKEV